jgi:hypothetical protein
MKERPLLGYRPLSEFLTSEGFDYAVKTAQNYGSRGIGPKPNGHWGRFPTFLPSEALRWANERLRAPRPTRRARKQPEISGSVLGTDRALGKKLGVDHKTVAAARKSVGENSPTGEPEISDSVLGGSLQFNPLSLQGQISDALDRAIADVAELGGVLVGDEFRRQLLETLDAAHTDHHTTSTFTSLPLSAELAADFINRITAAARALDRELDAMGKVLSEPDDRTEGAWQALALLQAQLVVQVARDNPTALTAEIASFEKPAAEWLAERRRGLAWLLPPAGSRGRPPSNFNFFVRRLQEVVRANGGELTHDRTSDRTRPEWQGTLQPAVLLLKAFLPKKGFFPRGKLGRALEDLVIK